MVEERGKRAVTNESLNETLLRSGWGCAGPSPTTGQVTMSAPWSVRERAFTRKLSLKDSICSREFWGKNIKKEEEKDLDIKGGESRKRRWTESVLEMK